MRSAWRDLRDDPSLPLAVASTVSGALGLLLVAFAWAGASRQLFLPLQVPWLVSGGLGGITLLGLSVTLLAVQRRRRQVALAVLQLEHAAALAIRIARLLETR